MPRHSIITRTFVAAQALLLLALTLAPQAARGQAVSAPADAALAAVGSGSDAAILERFMSRQAAPFTRAEIDHYRAEFAARPDLAHTKIYSPTEKPSLDARGAVYRVLKLFGRDKDMDVIVIDQEPPFVGLYRECVLVFSTGELQMFSQEQLRAAAANQIASTYFVPELREADRTGDAAKRHEVVFKADLLAAVAARLLGDDPLTISDIYRRTEGYYETHHFRVLDASDYPTAAERRRCLDLFLRHARPDKG
jgi:hypothetical protein